MAGGSQGANPSQAVGNVQDMSRPGGVAMQSTGGADPSYLQSVYASKMAAGDIGRGQSGGQFGGMQTPTQGYADGGLVFNPYAMYASPTQSFMQYPQQGQLNQPQLASTQYNGGPDSGTDYAPANMGFDNSGSDGGVGGQPAPMQTPLGSPPSGMTSGLPQQQGNKPLGLAQFQQPQGLQIQGNPTSQVVQRPQQR